MHFATPWGLLALLSIPAILILYLLKQKHQETIVPSHFLWKQTLAQSQAQKPWQKLKKNLLLFLQLLAAAVLSLALANPVVQGKNRSENYIYVLDTSLSMQARDEAPTRLEAAKAMIRESVQEAPGNAAFTLITMGRRADILVNRATEKNQVLTALSGVEAENGSGNFEEALTLLGLAKEQGESGVYFFTDTVYDFDRLDGQVIYLGQSTGNCAVSLVSPAETTEGLTVLVKVQNFSSDTLQRTVSLYGDDAVLDVEEILLQPGETRDVYFSGLEPAEVLYAKITPEDVLPADDGRYAVLSGGSEHKALLVTDRNLFLEKVLGLMPGLTYYKASEAQGDGYQLYVYDGVLPEELPADGHILLINPTENSLLPVGDTVPISGLHVEDNSFFGGLDAVDFAVSRAKRLTRPTWANVVLSAPETPLILAGTVGEQRIAVIGFDIHDSDLPLKMEFPLLMYQLMDWFFPESVHDMGDLLAGDAVSFHLKPDSSAVWVTTPDDRRIDLAPPFPAKSLEETKAVGVYTLTEEDADGGRTVKPFTVNPGTEGESDLRRTAQEAQAEAKTAGVSGSVSLQKGLLLLLLAILAIEWWVNCRAR